MTSTLDLGRSRKELAGAFDGEQHFLWGLVEGSRTVDCAVALFSSDAIKLESLTDNLGKDVSVP